MLDALNLYPKFLPCKFPHRHHQVWSTTSWQGASGLCFGGGVRPLGYPVGGGESLGWEVALAAENGDAAGYNVLQCLATSNNQTSKDWADCWVVCWAVCKPTLWKTQAVGLANVSGIASEVFGVWCCWGCSPRARCSPMSQDVPNSKDIGSRKPGIIPAKFGRIILEYVLHTGVI